MSGDRQSPLSRFREKPIVTLDVECTQMAKWLRGQEDPLGTRGVSGVTKLKVREVFGVAPVDARGLVEVNFVSPDGEALTAWLKDRVLVYLDEGW